MASLFEEALYKLTELKVNAPDTTSSFVPYECKIAYINIYYNYFHWALDRKIQNSKEMCVDYHMFHNEIYNTIINNCHDMQDAKTKKLFEYSDFQKHFLHNFDYLSENTKSYLKKLCDVVIDDSYNIVGEKDVDIVSLYWMLRFIPVYFEVITGCYKIYNETERRDIALIINNFLSEHIQKNYNYRLNVNGQSIIMIFFELFKNITDTVFFAYINEKCKIIQQKFKKYDKKEVDKKEVDKKEVDKKEVDKKEVDKKEVDKKEVDKKEVQYEKIIISKEFNDIRFSQSTKKIKYVINDLQELCPRYKIPIKNNAIKKSLEDEIINKLNGKTIIEKANNLNIFGDKGVDADGYIVAILQRLTNTLNNNEHASCVQIPKTIKSKVWDKYIGEECGMGKCYVCDKKIDSKHFECGHVVAKSQGGTDKIENLRPVCSLCNKSIGIKNMDDFKKKYLQ